MMKRFYQGVVNHPKIIIFLFTLLLCAGIVCKPLVKVNYDTNKYLPKDSASTVALDTMKKEFQGAIPDARVMVKNVSLIDALKMKKELIEIDGVNDVMWMDDEWTVVSADHSLSAHYENTILITDNKPEILSLTEDEKAAGFLELF